MNLSLFLARRAANNGQASFSQWILRIAVLAVALCMAVMLLTTALISGFKNEIGRKIFGFWGHIQITDVNVNRTLEATPIKNSKILTKDLSNLKSVQYEVAKTFAGFGLGSTTTKTTKGGVHHIQSFAMKPGIIKTKDNRIEGIVLKGIGKDFNWDFMQQYLVEGKAIEQPDTSAGRDILLSQQTATRLKLSVGDKLMVYFVQNGDQLKRVFRVSGLYKTGLEEYDKKVALVDIRHVQQLQGWDANQVDGLEIFLDDYHDIAPITEHIYSNMLPDNLYAQTIREKFPAIFEWLDLQDVNEVVIIALILLVSIINMMTALLILILERTNTIGILKALGSTDWDIRTIFLYHAAWIIGKGLFWGNFIGLGICFLQSKFKFIRLNEADYYLSYAPIEVNWFTVLMLNLLTLAIILIALLIPSYLVTRISPVKAIRFK